MKEEKEAEEKKKNGKGMMKEVRKTPGNDRFVLLPPLL